jgi:mannose-6-phosphate isomerase
MNADYPLRFEPIFRLALWGGRRLETVLGKTFPAGNDYAESWEIVDHGADQSCVTHGPLRGMALSSLVRELGADLLGRHNPQDHFPLLFKFLDVRENLSVQVHPNDEQAARLDPPDRGKSEAWFVLRAEPASRVYAGLRDGVDRTALERADRDLPALLRAGVGGLRVGPCWHRARPRSWTLGGRNSAIERHNVSAV